MIANPVRVLTFPVNSISHLRHLDFRSPSLSPPSFPDDVSAPKVKARTRIFTSPTQAVAWVAQWYSVAFVWGSLGKVGRTVAPRAMRRSLVRSGVEAIQLGRLATHNV